MPQRKKTKTLADHVEDLLFNEGIDTRMNIDLSPAYYSAAQKYSSDEPIEVGIGKPSLKTYRG